MFYSLKIFFFYYFVGLLFYLVKDSKIKFDFGFKVDIKLGC